MGDAHSQQKFSFLLPRLGLYYLAMANAWVEILETRLDGGSVSCVLRLPPGMRPAAGQYLYAFCDDAGDLLPSALFPASLPGAEMRFAAPIPPAWNAGMRLVARGPLGRGFTLPDAARRVALAALDSSAGALLPLAWQALQRGGEVVLYARVPPPGLPPAVEVLPLDLLAEAPAWAHYLALDAPLAALESLPGLLGARGFGAMACAVQVLARAAMPCAGVAACGVCAVSTRRGWKLACKDGPVFDWESLA